MKRILCGALFCFLVWGFLSVQAGMRVVYKLGHGEMNEIVCDGGLFRFGSEDFYTIWDADRGLVYYVMPKEKKYSVMTVEEAREQAETGLKQMEAMQKKLEEMSKKFKGFSKFLGESPQKEATKPEAVEVTYKFTREEIKIAGYPAKKIIEIHNGKPYAELWVSEKLLKKMEKACHQDKFRRMVEQMTPKDIPTQYESRDISRYLASEDLPGFLMREIVLGEGMLVEVVSVEEGRVPPGYFSIPKGFHKAEIHPFAPPKETKEHHFPGGKLW